MQAKLAGDLVGGPGGASPGDEVPGGRAGWVRRGGRPDPGAPWAPKTHDRGGGGAGHRRRWRRHHHPCGRTSAAHLGWYLL